MLADALIDTRHTGRLAQRPGVSEMLANPMRTFHTVRHLQARQIAYQALRRVQPVDRTDVSSGDAAVLLARNPVPQAFASPDVFDGRRFSFLNRPIAWGGADRWHPAGADDLWIFNLHYFKYLPSIDPACAQALLADWIAQNTDRGAAGWHPYPISLRVREWIEWLQAHPHAPASLRATVTNSLVAQVASLARRLEFNLMGNHLLENAITLCWAGCSCSGPLADAWLRAGEALFEQEIERQVPGDGFHEERSPMYQAQLAEAVLRLAEVAAQTPRPSAARLAASARRTGIRMLIALEPLVHPDGGYALMNDTALGIAAPFQTLVDRFDPERRAGQAVRTARAGGFYTSRHEDGAYLLFDAGPIGPDHQPGHGHAGALSFELSARGRRVVSDTGVLTYAAGSARRHDRSTAAHNTVEIDGRDQSEVWGAFRCGRRASILTAGADDVREGSTLVASYRGPGRRRMQPVEHARQIFVNRRVLAFTDTLTAGGDHQATLRVHLAPELQVKVHGHICHVADSHRPVATLIADGFDWAASSSPYHPEFGRELARPCLSARLRFHDQAVAKWWLLLN